MPLVHKAFFFRETHRYVHLRVSMDAVLVLLRVLAEGHRITTDGLPEDVKLVATQLDSRTNQVILRLESEHFGPVPEGAEIPELAVMVTDHTLLEASPAREGAAVSR